MLNERNIPLEEDGIEEEILVDEEVAITKAMWGDIGGNIENQTDLQNALDAKQDSLTEVQLNAVNSGITAEKATTYDGYADQIASKADQSALNTEATTRQQADTALGRRIDDEATARQNADNGLQSQIDAITSKSDVVDVVANYAALQAYDTSSLGNNDVIKVLDDETHEDALTYYRWSTTTQTWTYIGQEAPYYSKGQMDVMLQGKQNKLTAGANIQISNNTISATDTTYTAGNGLNLDGTEFSADTDILATKEDLDNYYTKPETDNLLAPKLEAEVVAELPTTGEEGKLYLTAKAHTTQTATGNPITATVAEEAGKIESFQLDGDTFQQNYEGKNLFSKNAPQAPNARCSGVLNGETFTITATQANTGYYSIILPNSSYLLGKTCTLSYTSSSSDGTGRVRVYASQQQTPQNVSSNYAGKDGDGAQTVTVTFPSSFPENSDCFAVVLYSTDKGGSTAIGDYSEYSNIQLEVGSTATSFEPYVGGTASPNPYYPQAINTVTGTQTVSINGTDYPIDLGSIELCKIGTYQDYIYKDEGKWYKHKEINKTTLTGSTYWGTDNAGRFYTNTILDYAGSNNIPFSSHFVGHTNVPGMSDVPKNTIAFNQDNATPRFYIGSYNTWANSDALKAWLNSNLPSVYYALATPTDTEITDQTLIAQLEAIRTASLENGANTITNTAAGSNLAGDMEIGYYGFAPRNRYDKFIWLDINNEYEQIGD